MIEDGLPQFLQRTHPLDGRRRDGRDLQPAGARARRFPGLSRLPYSLKILLENLLRREDGRFVDPRRHPGARRRGTSSRARRRKSRSRRRASCCRTSPACRRSSISPRCATASSGSAAIPKKVNPLQPVELVIDHSVQVDHYRELNAAELNAELEFARNKERYTFLRWGQNAFQNFRVVPPDTGIVHQVNLEYLARVVFREQAGGAVLAYPDTLVGTDSHTTMVNGLGVVGWGVGGIEAEAAMLGQPISMLIPEVVGFRLTDRLPEGRDGDRPRADDHRAAPQVRRRRQVRRVLRAGPRVPDDRRSRDARQHVAGIRRDDRHLPDRRDDARLPAPDRPRRQRRCSSSRPTRRSRGSSARPTRRIRSTPRRSSSICRPSSRAWRARSGRRTASRCGSRSRSSSRRSRSCWPSASRSRRPRSRRDRLRGQASGGRAGGRRDGRSDVVPGMEGLDHGAVVVAAITSCTNTSNPSVMIGAGLLARNAVKRGLKVEAVGEDEPRAGIAGRHRVLQGRGAARVSRRARLQPRRLRLHDLHRQQRSAARAGVDDRQGREPGRGVRAVRQPQLRGTHPVAGARELPGVAAARRGLRARRPDADRPDDASRSATIRRGSRCS